MLEKVKTEKVEKAGIEVTYEIADVNLAAYLLCKGFKLAKTPEQRYGPRSRIYVFVKTANLEEETLNFFNRNAPVDAHTYGEQVRSLLTLIKEVR
jgi:hypothetical protein